MTILYIEDNDPRSVLDFTRDTVQNVRSRAESLLKTIDGFLGSDLQYDPRVPLMMLELVTDLSELASDSRDRLVIDLLHLETPPSLNKIARAGGISTTRLKKLNASASPLPESGEDEGDE